MKKRKQKRKTKNLLLKVLIFLLVFSVLGVGVYYFLTAEDEQNSLTLIEKQWIESNKSTLIDVNIPNNVSLIANSGNGVLFDFLNYIEEETDLKFNKIPYNYGTNLDEGLGFYIIKDSNELQKSDVLVLEDNYIILSKEDKYLASVNEINGTSVGVLDNDKDTIGNHFPNNKLVYKNYTDIKSLLSALNSDGVAYIIVPRYSYLTDITNITGIFVNYNLKNVSNKYVLRLGKNERLNTIISKMLSDWLDKDYRKSLETYLMNFYSEESSLKELSKANLTSKVFKYGYVKDDGYNYIRNNDLYGVAGEYLNTLNNMADVEFDYIEYENKSDLEKALNTKKVDVAFLTFDYESENYLTTRSPFEEQLVALSKNYMSFNKTDGLTNRKLYLKADTYLYTYIKGINKNNNIVKDYNNKIDNGGIIVLDKNEYVALKDNSLNNYTYLFTDNFTGDYRFLVLKNNDVLYNVLSFALDNTNYSYHEEISTNNLVKASTTDSSFKGIYMIVILVILLPIVVIFLGLLIAKNSKNLKLTKKENILRYNDYLTNLKNRNYLNDNIEKWDDTKIYPRTIVIIDLNNLKYVNDNYGHEEGNELIKKAASILISTQLEKSDIIRTDGNEFLIYLIGYSKNQISTYISNLTKEFEKLPYGFGAAVGYSIIDDEIKTIDDAINEATIEMRMDKEKNYR